MYSSVEPFCLRQLFSRKYLQMILQDFVEALLRFHILVQGRRWYDATGWQQYFSVLAAYFSHLKNETNNNNAIAWGHPQNFWLYWSGIESSHQKFLQTQQGIWTCLMAPGLGWKIISFPSFHVFFCLTTLRFSLINVSFYFFKRSKRWTPDRNDL